MHWNYWVGMFSGLWIGFFIGGILMKKKLWKVIEETRDEIAEVRADILAKLNEGSVPRDELFEKLKNARLN